MEGCPLGALHSEFRSGRSIRPFCGAIWTVARSRSLAIWVQVTAALAERWVGAEQLGALEEAERFLDGHAIDARRDSVAYVLGKAVSRYRFQVATAAVIFLVMCHRGRTRRENHAGSDPRFTA